MRLPGKANVVHYDRRLPERAHCRLCGAELHGVPVLKMNRFKNLPKTQKRPERPYGGNLCPSCLKLHAKQAVFAAKP